MPTKFIIDLPPDFSYRHTVGSHGWNDLRPFELDETTKDLTLVIGGTVATLSEDAGRLGVSVMGKNADIETITATVGRVLRFDEDLTSFHKMARRQKGFGWISKVRAGRLLRSPTVFEDLSKSLCTTNCSWALTKIMVTNLVEKLGEPVGAGRRAFPTAKAMAAMPESFYREEIRAGYRSPYFVEMAGRVASGEIEPETWLKSELPTPELKKEIKSIKGIGDYAAENLLKLIGRYDGLALDSWLRGGFYEKHNLGEKCEDAAIHLHYEKFGDWKGLAIWCDMTKSWFDD